MTLARNTSRNHPSGLKKKSESDRKSDIWSPGFVRRSTEGIGGAHKERGRSTSHLAHVAGRRKRDASKEQSHYALHRTLDIRNAQASCLGPEGL